MLAQHLATGRMLTSLRWTRGQVHLVQLDLGGVDEQALHHARQSEQVDGQTFQQVGLVARVGHHAVSGVEDARDSVAGMRG